MLFRHEADPDRNAVLAEASEALGQDVAGLFDPFRDNPFTTNREVQIGVFLANEIHRRRLARCGIEPVASLGLSLGEYNHLVEIGAISFEDALVLVAARGRVYDDGPSGMMVSLYPTSREAVEQIVAEASSFGRVSISNDNAPKQLVIAGDRTAVERAAAIFEEREFAEAVVIEDRIPMHSPVFEPAAAAFRPYLEAAPWRSPSKPYLPNTTAEKIDNPTPEQIIAALTDHVFHPVLWRQSIERVLGTNPDATFVEVGPRRVLCNLLGRKWVRNPRFATDETEPEVILAALGELDMAVTHET